MQKLKLDVFYSLQKESAKKNNYSALQIDLSVQFLRNVRSDASLDKTLYMFLYKYLLYL